MFALLRGACAADHVRRKVAGRGQRASGGAESAAAADGSVCVCDCTDSSAVSGELRDST